MLSGRQVQVAAFEALALPLLNRAAEKHSTLFVLDEVHQIVSYL